MHNNHESRIADEFENDNQLTKMKTFGVPLILLHKPIF